MYTHQLNYYLIDYKTKDAVLIVKAKHDLKIIAMVLEDDPYTVVLCDMKNTKDKTNIEFEEKIIELVVTNHLMIVILPRKTYVFQFSGLKCIDQISTCYNPKGLGAVSCSENAQNKLIALPYKKVGEIVVHCYGMGQIVDYMISAHNSKISALAVNPAGTLIASASVRGTLVRIFGTESGDFLQELRRGTGPATINDLFFHPNLNILACSSNRTSIHLFGIKESVDKCVKSKEYGFKRNNSDEKESTIDNKRSNFKFLNFLSSFFNSEWSSTKLKIGEGFKV